jgi:hypothetical protein
MFSCSQTGVDKLAKMIQQNGWSEEAGALLVWPAASDRRKFEECLPHFMSTRTLEESFYSKSVEPSEILIPCAFIQKKYKAYCFAFLNMRSLSTPTSPINHAMINRIYILLPPPVVWDLLPTQPGVTSAMLSSKISLL